MNIFIHANAVTYNVFAIFKKFKLGKAFKSSLHSRNLKNLLQKFLYLKSIFLQKILFKYKIFILLRSHGIYFVTLNLNPD